MGVAASAPAVAAVGAIIVGLKVSYLYSLSSKRQSRMSGSSRIFIQAYWPWFGGSLTALAIASVFEERAYRRHEVRAPKPLRVERQSLLTRLGHPFLASPPATARLPANGAIIIGREAELVRLGDWFVEVKAGSRRVVFVAGEPCMPVLEA
ncbi:MAG: hypothetical protein ACREQT_12375, partial [Candidatus Binataceae bacterium]